MANAKVKFTTTKGVFVAEIFEDKAPNTAANFLELTEKGYYDGILFHRVIDDFMIQGGDPTGTGMGGPGYCIPDEFGEGLPTIRKGSCRWPTPARTRAAASFSSPWRRRRGWMAATPFSAKSWRAWMSSMKSAPCRRTSAIVPSIPSSWKKWRSFRINKRSCAVTRQFPACPSGQAFLRPGGTRKWDCIFRKLRATFVFALHIYGG